MRLFLRLLPLLLILACSPLLNNKATKLQEKSTQLTLDEWEKNEGFLDFYWDELSGRILLVIEDFDQELLYVNSLAAGVGSNDIGLDRGQLGGDHVVVFQRVGPKVLLTQINYDFRADSDNQMERQSVREAFAQSVLWGFTIVSEIGSKVIVDATPFLMRDAHGVSDRLKKSKQGSYKVDASRSAVYLARCKAFPKNTELEATITFVGDAEGGYIRDVTPSPKAVTVRQHHSFIKLPDDKYEPRVFDPRCGYFDMSYQDYATPIDQPLVKRFITRHRLQKVNPEAEKSEAVEPIIYYLDPGAPEPVRSALLDGARWWNQAFEAAGYIDAFQVKMLPEDADPMDVRYNLIQWVHRATRGWSYGASVKDPRTGEIIKGHVSLGSLRVRQDFLIAQGLLGPYKEDVVVSGELQGMALARLRQLSAHEIGHTIGLAHNFAASYNNRASVMDYPHPYITLTKDGELDFSDAYDDKIGEWDKRTVLYGYQDFSEGINEAAALKEILDENNRLGLKYISDADARPLGGAHPYAHLWDNGNNPIKEFMRISEIRRKVLNEFGTDRIPLDTPNSQLEEVLVPIYLSHRFQMEAVAKLIGGVDYAYTVKEDGQAEAKVVSDIMQKQALTTLIESINANFLALPVEVLKIIPPKPIGYYKTRESFKSKMGLVLDPVAIAESSVKATIGAILHPHRANRLVTHKALAKSGLGLEEVLNALFVDSFQSTKNLYVDLLNTMKDQIVLEELMILTNSGEANAKTKAICLDKLKYLQSDLKRKLKSNRYSNENVLLGLQSIELYLKDPSLWKKPAKVEMPAGSPIGCEHTKYHH